MAKLLYVESSPRKERSTSITMAKEFITAYRAAHPGNEVETWDLWSFPLPEFDGYTIDAKYRILNGQPHTSEEADAWGVIEDICNRFKAADRYLFSIPMWNFGIPYKLKHFIDVLVQPGLTFGFSPQAGLQGLVTDKPAVVIYARGNTYNNPNMMKLDYQKPYFESLLSFIGFTNIKSIVVEPTSGAPDTVEEVKNSAKELAVNIAQRY